MDSRILHYEFVTGESVNITVSAEIAEVIYDSRRMEHASNERSRYHTAFSLDSEDYEGTNLVSEKTPDDLMEELEDREHLLDCLAHLSENQRQRILMLAQGMSITEIVLNQLHRLPDDQIFQPVLLHGLSVAALTPLDVGAYLYSASASPSYAYSHGQFLFSAGLLRSHY